jgi:hypothetical protein
MAINIDRSEGVRDSARGLHVSTLCAREYQRHYENLSAIPRRSAGPEWSKRRSARIPLSSPNESVG